MALALSNLTANSSLSNPESTALVEPTGGAVLYVAVAVACTAGDGPYNSLVVGGLGGTWTNLAFQDYAARRAIWVFRGTGVSGSGAVTIEYTGAGTFQQMAWAVDQVTGQNTTTPNDVAVIGSSATTSLALTDVGVPDTGDAIYAAFAFEATADSFALGAAFTALGSVDVGAGGNIRQLKSGYDATAPLDETPDCSWTTSGNGAGGIGFIINVAAAGGPTQETLPATEGAGADCSRLVKAYRQLT